MILCCGEALIDMIPSETADGKPAMVPHSGGAVFNTAVALGRLGAATGFLSGLSTDMFGRQLSMELEASNVDTTLAVRSDRPTTLAFVELIDGHATYTFYDENTAGRMLGTTSLPRIPEAVSALYFGGISLCSEPAAETYAHLATTNAERVVMLDPNIRPGFISDEVSYRNRLERMMAVSDIIKISDDDLAWLVGPEIKLETAATELLERGASVVILTRGAAGAVAYTKERDAVSVKAPSVDVVDTVGAGDTFNAGVLVALSEASVLSKASLASIDAETLKTALAFGAAVAAVTVSRTGADAPWRSEVAAG